MLDDNYKLSAVGRGLAELHGHGLFQEFAKHILLRLGGLRVIEGVREMTRDNLLITGDSLAEYLSNQGFRVTIHNTAINSLRMWLEKGGVFAPDAWAVDAEIVDSLIGLSRPEVAGLVRLNAEQQAFVLALCRINPVGGCSAADVRELAEQILGRTIPRDSLPKRVLKVLADLGYIEFKSGGTSGGKAAVLKTTANFKSGVLAEFLLETVKSLDPLLTMYYATTPTDIYMDLASSDAGKRGKALEAYAVHIMRLMGFRFVGWRKRAADTTGNAEIDVVMRGLFGNSPTRWQVQCKNTPKARVDLEDVAKEVGLVPLTNATHILMIVNGAFTKDARTYVAELMRATPLTVFLLDRHDFEKVKSSSGALAAILKARAQDVAGLNRRTTMWGW